MIKFNALTDKKPTGAAVKNKSITFSFYADEPVKSLRIVVRNHKDKVVSYPFVYQNSNMYFCEFSLPESGIYYYRFELDCDYGTKFIGRDDDYNAIIQDWSPEFQLTVTDYEEKCKFNGGVIYHIFVDRFYKSDKKPIDFTKKGTLKSWNEDVEIQDESGNYFADDFFGGNLYGIIEKLDYFAKLKITHLYLSPIFQSFSNHRYDTADYNHVDELLGGDEAFDLLIQKAKKKGIGIILDGVFNHSGADSKYFNRFATYKEKGAYQSQKSKYYDWYTFTNFPEEYNCWWGMTCVPTFNKDSSGFKKFLFGSKSPVIKWTKKGISGWRLDVVDELPINFMNQLNKTIRKANKNAIIIGEVWEDASVKESYSELRPYFTANQLDGVMNYVYKECIIDYILTNDLTKVRRELIRIVNNYPQNVLNNCMTLLDSHDTVRILNRLSGIDVNDTTKKQRKEIIIKGEIKSIALERVKMAVILHFTLAGTPTIYYGDEIGMQGFEDPLNRRPFDWENINQDLLEFYEKVSKIRSKYKEIFMSTMVVIYDDNNLIYERKGSNGTIRVVINNNDYATKYNINAKSIFKNQKICESDLISAHSYDILYYKG